MTMMMLKLVCDESFMHIGKTQSCILYLRIILQWQSAVMYTAATEFVPNYWQKSDEWRWNASS